MRELNRRDAGLRRLAGPAGVLRNRFTDKYSAAAPVGHPAPHHLTAPIRAAAAAPVAELSPAT